MALTEPTQKKVFQVEAALSSVDGDEDLLLEIVDLFLESCPKLVSAMKEAVAKCDAPALMRSAHSLKGSVGYFGASRALEAVLKLEQMGQEGNWSRVGYGLGQLEDALEELGPALIGLTNELKRSA
jgi:two-component system, sensor histidine kinase and response regulator